MFALPTYVGSAQRVVATLVATALILMSLGIYSTQAEAANVREFSDLLTDSAPSSASDHTFVWTAVNGIGSTATITLTFPTAPDSFNFGTVGNDDIALIDDGVTLTGGGADYQVDVLAYPTIQLVMTGTAIAAGSTTTVQIGSNAGGSGDQITNPATSNTSYEILLDSGASDTGQTRVAIVDTVTVTAQVPTIFDFTVTGFPNGTGMNVNGTSTTGTSSATEIPFGDVSNGIIETIAQRLNVSTNARNGFVVTVEQDQNLLSSTGADIDGFQDGNYQNTPIAWAGPTPDVNDENTWGHWGITSSDDLNSGEFITCAASSSYGCWVAASSTPREIFAHDGPADGTTRFIGSTTVGYQIEITGLQEAGDDYTTTLTYIATPTF